MVTTSVDEFRFTLLDYIVFGIMILVSVIIGVYYGYIRKSPEEKAAAAGKTDAELDDYLLGGRQMKTFPVAMSLVASYVSAVTVIGTPSEMYSYGTQYFLIVVPIALHAFIVTEVFLPVFYALDLTSSYHYLTLRFHPHVTTIAALLFLIDELLFLPIIVYSPSIAFQQVTGASLWLVALVIVVSCTLYTLIGGMKAVVSTDTWQTIVMCLAIIIVVLLGLIFAGGFGPIFDAADKGNRLELFNFSPSMTARNTFWSVMIGGLSYWTSFNAVNQTMVQRYMSLPNIKVAKGTVALFVVTIILFVSLVLFAGLIIFEYYYHCDPVTAGMAEKSDQVFPLYVMQSMGHLKGITGLFMAGVVGAALSSLSVVLHSSATIIYEDILVGLFKVTYSAKHGPRLVQLLIILLAMITYALTFFVEKLGAIFKTATALSSIAASTTFGLFALGILIPWSNKYGAFVGALAGFLMTSFLAFGSQYASFEHLLPNQELAVLTDGCEGNYTAVIDSEALSVDDEAFVLFRLSYLWISPIGIASVLIVGTIVSLITGKTDVAALDRKLISPVLHRCLPEPSTSL